MSMTNALRKLLRKMGGSPSNGDNSDELVSKIADAYSGGGGGVLVVEAETDEETAVTVLFSTWQEIHDALLSNGAVISYAGSVFVVTEASYHTLDGSYRVTSSDGVYTTSAADGYPCT